MAKLKKCSGAILKDQEQKSDELRRQDPRRKQTQKERS